MFKSPEQYRVTEGKFATKKEHGPNGVFFIPIKRNKFDFHCGFFLQVIASNVKGWEQIFINVVSHDKKKVIERTPTWDEMCMAQKYFWDPEDVCIQIHADESNYKKLNKFALQILKKVGSVYEIPISLMR
jgi:hypothetical protein